MVDAVGLTSRLVLEVAVRGGGAGRLSTSPLWTFLASS